MLYLNLSKEFNPMNSQSHETISFEAFTFSGGEPHIKLDYNFNQVQRECETGNWCNVWISHRINSFEDLGLLMVAVDALRGTYPIDDLYLYLPYFPGARQDRRMVNGEPLTVKVYADIINSLGFKAVKIVDPHSDVAPALIDNCFAIDNHRFVNKCLELMPFTDVDMSILDSAAKPHFNLISPDAGSNKKMKDLAKSIAEDYYPFNLIKCDKTRDVSTGKITGFDVYADDLGGLPSIIVDDICDGGGTFIGLAEQLINKNCGKLYLIVTHGIFNGGFNILQKYFDGIFTTDSFYRGDNGNWRMRSGKDVSDILTVIQLKEL